MSSWSFWSVRGPPPFVPHAVHSIIPVSASHQWQAVRASLHADIDGSRAVLIQAGLRLGNRRHVVRVFPILRQWWSLDEGHDLREHGRITCALDVLMNGEGQPESIV